MKTNKKVLVGLAVLGMVIMSFLFGFATKGLIQNGKSIFRKTSVYAEIDELKDVLSKYHYDLPSDEELLEGAAQGMVNSLNDPYTYYYEYKPGQSSDGESYVGIGIGLAYIDGSFYVTTVTKNSSAFNNGITKGDIIISINDKSTKNMNLTSIKDLVKGDIGDKVKMSLKRGAKNYDVELTISRIETPTIESKKIGDKGYIKINEFSSLTAKKFADSLSLLEQSGITGLVIDVRDNPGGYLSTVNDILRIFLTGNAPFVYMEEVCTEKTTPYKPNENTEKKPYDIKVLMNNNSASASEVFALAMNRVMGYELIGEQSFGKGVYQIDYEMESVKNMYLHITLGNWYGFNKESIQDVGIAPTTEVVLPEYFNASTPLDGETFSKDSVSEEVKNAQLMLSCLGFDLRTDGYFDDNTETIISTNYSSVTLTPLVSVKIYEDYLEEIVKPVHDTQLNKALEKLGS